MNIEQRAVYAADYVKGEYVKIEAIMREMIGRTWLLKFISYHVEKMMVFLIMIALSRFNVSISFEAQFYIYITVNENQTPMITP